MTNYTQKFSLKGQIAMVTDSARGVGAEISIALGEVGATVVVCDRDVSSGEKHVAELRSRGVEAIFIKLDVTVEEDWQEVAATIELQFERLDILVNNTGCIYDESVEIMSLERCYMLHGVNVDGVFLGCKYIVALMERGASAARRASIINMSSMSGLSNSELMSVGCYSDGAESLLTKAMAAEYGGGNVRVNSVHPGLIKTDMGDEVRALLKEQLCVDEEEAMDLSMSLTPLRALGTLQDLAAAVIFLASSASNFVTATEIIVDGGISGCQ